MSPSRRLVKKLRDAVEAGCVEPKSVRGDVEAILKNAAKIVDNRGRRIVSDSEIQEATIELFGLPAYPCFIGGPSYRPRSMDRYCVAVTSLSPSDKSIERQAAALDSWKRFGLTVHSIQRSSEMDLLRSRYRQVDHWSISNVEVGCYSRETQPIKSLVAIAREVGTILLINSDIEIYGSQSEIVQRIAGDKRLVVGIRFNYKPNPGFRAVREKYGLDAFVLTPEMAASLPDSPLSIGKPVWDYWLPAHFRKLGYAMDFIGLPLFFHQKHALGWNDEEWMFGGRWLESHYGDEFTVNDCVGFRRSLPFPPVGGPDD